MRRPILNRLVMPVAVPVLILAIGIVVLYLTSRMLLGSSKETAPVIAGVAATVAFLGAAFFATVRPNRQQMVSVLAVPALAMLIGGIVGEIAYDGAEEEGEEHGGEVLVGTIDVSMDDNFFAPAPTGPDDLVVALDEEIVFDLVNDGQAIHNMRIAGPDGEYDTDDDVVSVPDLIRPGEAGQLATTFGQAGTVAFRCDFHPVEMVGTITVVEDGGEAGGGGATEVVMGDNFFDPNEIEVDSGVTISFALVNEGQAIHNMRIAGADGEYDTDDDAVSVPDLLRAGDAGTLDYSFEGPGEFIFRCDFHPVEMTGVIVAR